MSGRPSDGRPLAIDPTVGTSKAEGLDRGERADDGHERTRNALSETAQAENHRQRARPTSRVRPCVSPRWVMRCQACSKKSPVPADPEQLRQLPDDDRQREADDQALEHGWAGELGQEAEAQQTRDQGGDARRRGQAGGERGEAPAPTGARSATVAADRAAVAAMGPTMSTRELPRAARAAARRAPRRGPRPATVRDARVSERLRNQDRPEREARDQIAAKPRPLIAAQRTEEAPSAGRSRGGAGTARRAGRGAGRGR